MGIPGALVLPKPGHEDVAS